MNYVELNKQANFEVDERLEKGSLALHNCSFYTVNNIAHIAGKFYNNKNSPTEKKDIEKEFQEALKDKKTLASSRIISRLSLAVQGGERICIVGDNNSGKNDLLLALLGEYKQLGGKYRRNGSTSYLPS